MDFSHYRQHLGDALAAHDIALHAYVLMTERIFPPAAFWIDPTILGSYI
ncbi:hypothetical protein [Pseudoxanthomonas koreensis]|nr:hypothetical protein [Pseudoxanthomonas koreensis]